MNCFVKWRWSENGIFCITKRFCSGKNTRKSYEARFLEQSCRKLLNFCGFKVLILSNVQKKYRNQKITKSHNKIQQYNKIQVLKGTLYQHHIAENLNTAVTYISKSSSEKNHNKSLFNFALSSSTIQQSHVIIKPFKDFH